MEERVLSQQQHQVIAEFMHNREDTDDLFISLLQTVQDSKAEFEGNICYPHKSFTPLQDKIRQFNLAFLAQQCTNMLEIGFNAGHSAAIALLSNPKLKVTAIDDGKHPYVKPCYELLLRYFGSDRIRLIIGDSTSVLPAIRQDQTPPSFDLIHIDGSNQLKVVNDDLYHCICLSAPYAYLILNDVQKAHIADLWEYYTDVTNAVLPKLNVFPNPPHVIATHAVGVVNYQQLEHIHNVYIEKSKMIHEAIAEREREKERQKKKRQAKKRQRVLNRRRSQITPYLQR